jgi:hypothetical protein
MSHNPMHHHQNSLSHYPSPPNGHAHQQQQQQQAQLLAQGSPAGTQYSPHWHQQLMKYEVRALDFRLCSYVTPQLHINSINPPLALAVPQLEVLLTLISSPSVNRNPPTTVPV